jgi:hypothetical protein
MKRTPSRPSAYSMKSRTAEARPAVLEHVEQIALTVDLPLDEHRRVADGLLLGEDLRHVF